MVIVRFNQWEEFLAELQASPPEDRLTRLTLSVRYDGQGVPYLTLVAGYLDKTNIIEFVQYLGLQPADPRSPRAQEVRSLVEERKKALEAAGFRVKSGRYHVPPPFAR